MVGFIELLEAFDEGHLEAVDELLARVLEDGRAVPSAHGHVGAADHARDAGAAPGGVVVDVNSQHHNVAHLGRHLAAPQLAAQLAVDLQRHLLDHGGHFLLVGDGLEVDDLTGDWLLHTAELLDGGVPVVPGGGHDGHHHLHVGVDGIPDRLQVGLGPVVGQGLHVRLGHLHTHLWCQLGDQRHEALSDGLVLRDVDKDPLLKIYGGQHLVAGSLPAPVGLGVYGEGETLPQQQLLGVDDPPGQLNTSRGQL